MSDVLPDIKIRVLTDGDRGSALAVINTAARWYQEFLSAEGISRPGDDTRRMDTRGRTSHLVWSL